MEESTGGVQHNRRSSHSVLTHCPALMSHWHLLQPPLQGGPGSAPFTDQTLSCRGKPGLSGDSHWWAVAEMCCWHYTKQWAKKSTENSLEAELPVQPDARGTADRPAWAPSWHKGHTDYRQAMYLFPNADRDAVLTSLSDLKKKKKNHNNNNNKKHQQSFGENCICPTPENLFTLALVQDSSCLIRPASAKIFSIQHMLDMSFSE